MRTLKQLSSPVVIAVPAWQQSFRWSLVCSSALPKTDPEEMDRLLRQDLMMLSCVLGICAQYHLLMLVLWHGAGTVL